MPLPPRATPRCPITPTTLAGVATGPREQQSYLGRLASVAGGLLLTSACVVSTYGSVGAPLDVPPVPKVVSDSPAPNPGPATPISEGSEERITASHLLIAYRGALRAAPSVIRSREEAFTRAQEALSRAQKGEPFATLVEEYSDDLGSAARAGDLGSFRRQDMVAEFSEAAFKLKPGELSGIVESQFGFHVILRTGQPEPPK